MSDDVAPPDDESAAPRSSALSFFAESIGKIKDVYGDIGEVDVDLLFLAFLQQEARFGFFTFGPLTVDVRIVEDLFARTYAKLRDPDAPRGFTPSSRRYFALLAEEVARSGSRMPDALHFLLAFMRSPDGLPARVFGETGIAPEQVAAYAEQRASREADSAHQRLYSPEAAADYLGVHVQTVRVWIRDGKLPASRLLGQRALRIRESDLARALEPVDPEND